MSNENLTKDMIGKICQNISGGRILYIGPIFFELGLELASRCEEAIFLDEDEERINTANRALFSVDKAVRQKLEFIYADFLTYNIDMHTFDTIVINIDDSEDYQLFCIKASCILKASGTAIFLRNNEKPISTKDNFSMYYSINSMETLAQKQNIIITSIKTTNNYENLFLELIKTYRSYQKQVTAEEIRWKEKNIFESSTGAESRALSEKKETLQRYKIILAMAIDDQEHDIQQRKSALEKILKGHLEKTEALNKKNQDVQRRKDSYEQELLRYKEIYKNILHSKRYKMGTILSEIYYNPLRLFYYGKKAFAKLKPKQKSREQATEEMGFNFDGISVIIPTYKEQPFFDDCVRSVLQQSFNPKKIEVIISVNGDNKEYYKSLKDKYESVEQVKVLYTKVKGLSSGRNYAIQYATKEYLTFLDDDDYFTPGYLEEMSKHLDHDIVIVCGRVDDQIDSKIHRDTYINRELGRIAGGGRTTELLSVGSLFTTAWAKLYRSNLFSDGLLTPFNEQVRHTEDILFWAENFHKITSAVYCCDSNGSEAYVRRVLENSMSRPSSDQRYEFSITDRIEIIKNLADKIFDPNKTLVNKRFLLNKINSQTDHMLTFYSSLSDEIKEAVVDEIIQADCFYINKSKFSQIQGIAFCHNFSPASDTSAYVATKRLEEISSIVKRPIKWDVISANMSNCRKVDNTFGMFYANYVIHKQKTIAGPAYFNEKSQYQFGCKAFDAVKDVQADFIYSRSMFAGSHVAASKYKALYPNAIWYAEFSDPIFMGTDNKERPKASHYVGDEAFLNDFWKNCETDVFEHADIIIFTNDNQRKYMLANNQTKYLSEVVQEKSIILHHPVIDYKFCKIIQSSYQIDHKKINVGYFGSFYPNRQHSDLLTLLANSNIHLHLFVPNPDELSHLRSYNVSINSVVDHLEFLNIATLMDYLYLNDIDFEGNPNPYLPSKLADYIATETKIIAQVNEGSALAQIACDLSNIVTDASTIQALQKQRDREASI